MTPILSAAEAALGGAGDPSLQQGDPRVTRFAYIRRFLGEGAGGGGAVNREPLIDICLK